MAARAFDDRLRRAVDGIWNRGNLDLADAVVAAGYVNHGGLIPDIARGPEAVKIAAVVARMAFPELRVTVADLVGDDERVAVRWTARAAPDAADALAGVTFGRIVRGRIAESWTYWERADASGPYVAAQDRARPTGVGRKPRRRTRACGLGNLADASVRTESPSSTANDP